MAEPLGLQVHGLSKGYGGVQAVSDLSFSLQGGECVALIGPNGAGKSTTFACIAGQLTPSAGQLLWSGQALDGLSPAQRLRLGIARSFQVAQTFEALSLLQNVQLVLPGAPVMNPWKALERVNASLAMELLARVGLHEQAAVVAAALPYGAKKRLELALALAGLEGRLATAPALLLLDEPAAGLAAAERSALMQLVHGLTRARNGTTPLAVLYTEHNMDAVFGFADRVLVLMEGRLAATGTPQEVAANAHVRSQYLGHTFQAAGTSHA
jgi:branched-chain amino acid transport system ATP-binding protein